MARRRVDPEAMGHQLAGRCFICELVAGNPEFAHFVVYGDFSRAEYLALQDVVRRVGEAVRSVVPTERLYILSLGSQQGNRHVHWHVAPLPPGVPFEEQQLAALDTNLRLDLSDAELQDLVLRIRNAVV